MYFIDEGRSHGHDLILLPTRGSLFSCELDESLDRSSTFVCGDFRVDPERTDGDQTNTSISPKEVND